MGPTKLAKQLGIPFQEAKNLLARYFQLFPAIKRLMDNLTDFAKENKYALSPLDGRRRDLSDLDWDNPRAVAHAMNVTKNLPFQGGGASTTKMSLVRIRNEIKKKGLKSLITNVIHDI